MEPFSAVTENLLGIEALFCGAAMQRVMAAVNRVAQTSATVLITGESGTGKELIARAIHQNSLRCTKPWIDVNCGAIPDNLVESELFGYDKGAFSGADSAKPGLFETAHTGTLFLDEIGDLPARLQVKLLRVLDGVPYYRLGGTKKVLVDVRVIAATNSELHAAIKVGEFRQDLFHRLNQLHIHVPSLRDRVDEIVPLAEFFLARSHPDYRFASAAREKLKQYSWPGNIRELKNVVFQAAIFADSPEIQADHLRFAGQDSGAAPAAASGESLDAIEQATILRTLKDVGGHHERAAAVLGISRRTLSRKLKSYAADNLVSGPLKQDG